MGKKDRLSETLQFTEDELELNRNGQLSGLQHTYLFSRRPSSKKEMSRIFAGTAWGFVFLLIAVFSLPAPSLRAAGLFSFFVAAVFFSLIAWWYNKIWQRVKADLSAGRVETVTGTIAFEITDVEPNEYYVKTQGLKFQVSKEAMLAFQNGQPYHLYYAPNSLILLSAEPDDIHHINITQPSYKPDLNLTLR